jgi:hypothetical protein
MSTDLLRDPVFCEPLVQWSADEEVLLDTLAGYVGGGLYLGDGVVVVAGAAHLLALEERLQQQAIDTDQARAEEQLIAIEAEQLRETLQMRPAESRGHFVHELAAVIARARGAGRHVRVFGEFAAFASESPHVWAQLDQAWRHAAGDEAVSLLCTYPKNGASDPLPGEPCCQAALGHAPHG